MTSEACAQGGVVCDRPGLRARPGVRRGRADLSGALGPGQDQGPFLGEFPAAPALSGSPRPLSGPLLVWSRRRSLPAPCRPPSSSLRPPPPGWRLLGTGTHSPQTRRRGGHWRRGAHAPARARPGHGGPPPASRDLRLGLGSGVLRPAEEVRPGGGPEAQGESFPARGRRASSGSRGPARTDGPGGRDPPAAPGRLSLTPASPTWGWRRRGGCAGSCLSPAASPDRGTVPPCTFRGGHLSFSTAPAGG